MITTVTLNPAIDRTIVLDQFEFGSVNRVQSVREDIGGKGINVSRVLNALGSPTIATGLIGRRNLAQVRQLLDLDHIQTDLIEIDAPTRTNTKLIERRSRTTTDLNEPGFAVTVAELEAIKRKIDQYVDQSQFIVFSGSIPQGVPTTIYQDLIRQVRLPCLSVLDVDGALLLAGLRAGPTLIKPNLLELETALGRKLTTHLAIAEAGRELIERYGIRFVLISMGGDGCICVTQTHALFAHALSVEVRGTVGAGDSMLAGFVHCLSRHDSLEQALTWATACGALAVSKIGTEAFSLHEVQSLASQVKLDALSL